MTGLENFADLERAMEMAKRSIDFAAAISNERAQYMFNLGRML